ncbi:MAG: hypothetical protein ACP5MZ_01895 [Candidatus Micrarchaeia archaeon]
MFFKKPDIVKQVPFTELARYMDSLFDSKISKVMDSVDRLVSSLSAEAARFAELSEKFSSTDLEPDMEYIEHMSEGFIKSQKATYSKSLYTILTERAGSIDAPADTKYERIKIKKEAYEYMLQEILKLNSKFSMILVGYSKQMDAFKRQFSRMDKILKGINEQLKGVSEEVGAYNHINDEIARMMANIELINELDSRKRGLKIDRNEKADEKLRNAISAIEAERSSYESKKRSLEEEEKAARHSITSLLQPLSRASRIYDHDSKGKVRITDCISDPFNLLCDSDNYRAFENELRKMREYILSNNSKFKGYESEVSHISDILDGDIPNMMAKLQRINSEIDAIKGHVSALSSKLHEMESEKNKAEERFGMLADQEEHLRKAYASVTDSKSKIEELCFEAYRVRLSITGLPDQIE